MDFRVVVAQPERQRIADAAGEADRARGKVARTRQLRLVFAHGRGIAAEADNQLAARRQRPHGRGDGPLERLDRALEAIHL